MTCTIRLAVSWLVLLLSFGYAAFGSAADWPHWRGPSSNGIAPTGPLPPLVWDENTNVLWSTDVPGRGHGSPTVVGNQIYLATADVAKQTQSVLAFSRATGRLLWQSDVFEQVQFPQIHAKNTHASATVACDGEKLFIAFYTGDGVWGCALTTQGQILWKRKVGTFEQKYPFGYAASPLLYRKTVVFACEAESETSLTSIDTRSGETTWKARRSQNTSYSSPILLHVGGRDQILISGNRQICSYDPETGKQLWCANGSAKHTAGTVTGEGNLVVASGGYPESETFCAKADGSGTVMWRNNQKCYEQSMLMHDGYVYAINDSGIAFCWDAETGAEQWKKRLAGPISSSPVLVGDRIYATNEKGTTFVFAATPRRFVNLGKNQLGQETFATPAILDGQIYMRVATGHGSERRETLYCLGETTAN